MKIGIIGAGAIGKKHAEAAIKAGAEVGWVVDINSELGLGLAQEYGAKYTESPDALWDDSSTPAVIIGVPNWLHKPFTIAALSAGKDVLLEKPMALNVQECHTIAHVAEEQKRVLQVGYVHRYTGVGRMAHSLVQEGRIGDIYHARANLFLRRGVPGLGRWFTNKEFSGGGALIDVGVHLIDLALFLLDFPEPVQVLGQTYENFGRRMKDYDYEDMWSGPPNYDGICNVEDAAEALIKFANGTTLEIHVAWAGNYPCKLMPVSQMAMLGDRGGLAFELFGSEVHLTQEQNGKLVDSALPIDGDDFFLMQMHDFLKSIALREVQGANSQQATAVQAVVEAVYESSRIGEPVAMI
ncbi:MAG: Gfo/Idh/MocA family oxidoreductase [Bythopirellula sp.]|nr:Gfo/Idh/MocA family oxidoreductase [Bythopirellula sp.]